MMISRTAKKWLGHVLSLILGLAIVVAWLYAAGWERISSILSNIFLPGLAAGLLVYAGSWWARTSRLAVLLRPGSPALLGRELFRINTASFAVNNLLPARLGEVAAVLLLVGRKVSWPQATAVVIQTRALDFLVLVLAILVYWAWPKPVPLPPWIHWSGLSMIIVILVLGLSATLLFRRPAQALNGKPAARERLNLKQRLLRALKQIVAAYWKLLVPGAKLGPSLAVSMVIWGLEICTTYFVALSLGTTLAWHHCVLAVAFANLAKALPITPGGLGVYESGFTAVLLWAKVPLATAVTIALADHLFKKAFVLSFGVPAIFSYGLRWPELWQARKRP